MTPALQEPKGAFSVSKKGEITKEFVMILDPDSDATAQFSFNADRRSILAVIGSTGLFLLSGASAAFAQAAPISTDAFMNLSRFLTLDRPLDGPAHKAMGSAIAAALNEADPDFSSKVNDLLSLIRAQKLSSVDFLDLNQMESRLANCVHAIINAWYSGLIHKGDTEMVVAYNDALIFDPIRNDVVVPTYCLWGPDYWSKPAPDAPTAH